MLLYGCTTLHVLVSGIILPGILAHDLPRIVTVVFQRFLASDTLSLLHVQALRISHLKLVPLDVTAKDAVCSQRTVKVNVLCGLLVSVKRLLGADTCVRSSVFRSKLTLIWSVVAQVSCLDHLLVEHIAYSTYTTEGVCIVCFQMEAVLRYPVTELHYETLFSRCITEQVDGKVLLCKAHRTVALRTQKDRNLEIVSLHIPELGKARNVTVHATRTHSALGSRHGRSKQVEHGTSWNRNLHLSGLTPVARTATEVGKSLLQRSDALLELHVLGYLLQRNTLRHVAGTIPSYAKHNHAIHVLQAEKELHISILRMQILALHGLLQLLHNRSRKLKLRAGEGSVMADTEQKVSCAILYGKDELLVLYLLYHYHAFQRIHERCTVLVNAEQKIAQGISDGEHIVRVVYQMQTCLLLVDALVNLLDELLHHFRHTLRVVGASVLSDTPKQIAEQVTDGIEELVIDYLLEVAAKHTGHLPGSLGLLVGLSRGIPCFLSLHASFGSVGLCK